MARLLARWPLVLTLLALLVPALMHVSSTSAMPISCTTMIRGYEDWAFYQRQGAGTYLLTFHMVSNQDNGIVSYSEGLLNLRPPVTDAHTGAIIAHGYFGTDTQEFSQYFSDRRFTAAGHSRPFSPTATDLLHLSVSAQDGGVGMRLDSWGRTNTWLTNVICDQGVMYGWQNVAGPGTTNKPLFILSLVKNFQPR